jgi:acyl dehydratase
MPAIKTLEDLAEFTGREIALTDWFEMTQERINQYADATDDHQWIHVDRERSERESPYKATIAHGLLTLSLVPKFLSDSIPIDGLGMAINYGLNRVRFPAAVRAGALIRARIVLLSTREVPDATEAIYSITIESQDSDKPCCVAEMVVRYYR